ncbi:MAG: hypothetical protein LBF78_07045 [Treponema sp.]|jgi:hypothetical protein|nr:hypothetical protein [Treponema sp.]
MAHSKSYIPGKDADFDSFAKNIVVYVNTKVNAPPESVPPPWTFIPTESLAELNGACAAWDAAYVKTKIPHTSAETEEKNRTRKVLEKTLRTFVKRFLRYPPVTPEDRAKMGIPELDTTRTPTGKPKTRPEFSIVVKDIRRLALPFKDQGSASKARPYGMNGALVSWGILDAPPADEKALTEHALATRTPFILQFKEEDRGKTVYITMQWQTEGGVLGHPSEIQSAIIP